MINPLAGKPLRYLIGAGDPGRGADDVITEVPYENHPVKHGISIAYCNLFDQTGTGAYGPYLKPTDTAQQYNERVVDPSGRGWRLNLATQFEQRVRQKFEYIELDNSDAYKIADVISAINFAAAYGLKVIAKNPGTMAGGSAVAVRYVAHPAIYGMIVERDAGHPEYMDQLRHVAHKPELPVWFVAFGKGKLWARSMASAIKARDYFYMSVTYSTHGEYKTATDILVPRLKT